MTTIKTFIKKNSVLMYFLLTFIISWGSVLIIVGPGRFPGTPDEMTRLLPFVILAMLGGPSVAGLLLTGLVSGRAGLHELRAKLLRWRVEARWYAFALLTAPLVFTTVLFALSFTDPVFLPGILTTGDKLSLLLSGIAGGLAVGFFEELGWTGFAVPRLRLRHSVVMTGLIVGVLWGAWHFLTNDLWASGTISGGLSLPVFLSVNLLGFLVGQLPAYRILMVWVYERTESLFVVMLMHASLTASTLILGPLAIAGVPILSYGLALATAMWLIVAVVAISNHGQLSRQPFQKQMA
jgi:uncharacterized protein